MTLAPSSPIDDVDQIPRILKQVELQVAIPVNGDLCRWEQCAGTLSCVLVVDINFSCCYVECPRPRVPGSFCKCDPAVGNETHPAASRRGNYLHVGYTETHRPPHLKATGGLHSLERIHQPSLLTLLKGIDQRLLVFRRRVPSDDQLDRYSVTQLCAGAAGREINGLELCGCQQRECQNRRDAGQPECSFHISLHACVETKLLYPRPRVAGFLR